MVGMATSHKYLLNLAPIGEHGKIMKTLYSIGHSNRSIKELIDKLQENKITDLVDVRTYPTSKYNPQYKKEQLKKFIENAGIKYHWRGRNLGGLAGNVKFNETITAILKNISEERRFCVMCSEARHQDCHRSDTIEKEVIKQGGEMYHLRWLSKAERDKIELGISQGNIFAKSYKD